jgi:hypothetical protein
MTDNDSFVDLLMVPVPPASQPGQARRRRPRSRPLRAGVGGRSLFAPRKHQRMSKEMRIAGI